MRNYSTDSIFLNWLREYSQSSALGRETLFSLFTSSRQNPKHPATIGLPPNPTVKWKLRATYPLQRKTELCSQCFLSWVPCYILQKPWLADWAQYFQYMFVCALCTAISRLDQEGIQSPLPPSPTPLWCIPEVRKGWSPLIKNAWDTKQTCKGHLILSFSYSQFAADSRTQRGGGRDNPLNICISKLKCIRL